METAISVINLNPTTKQEAENFAMKLISEVEAGVVNPLELHVKLTAMEKAIEQVKKHLAPLTLKEAEKFGAKTFDAYSSEIAIKEVGVKYDFSNCNDEEWNSLNDKKEACSTKLKERETFLKSLKNPMEIVIEGTGEIAKIYPPAKSGTTSIAVKLK